MKRIAIIGGTGFGQSLFGGTAEVMETPCGPAQVTFAARHGAELAFVARHGAGHSVPPHRINHRANIHALKDWGADAVLATTAVGSLRLDIAPGNFVVPDDLLDMTKGEVVTFYDADVRHTDMSEPYNADVRRVLLSTMPDKGTDGATVHASGTYVCLSGPRYETPAEIRLLAQWGGAVVGMTGAPEVVLCREAGLRYAAVSLATNYGCGLAGPGTLAHADVEQRMAAGRGQLAAWLLRAVDALAGAKE